MSSRRRPRQHVFMSSGQGTLSKGNDFFLRCLFSRHFLLFNPFLVFPPRHDLERPEFPKKSAGENFLSSREVEGRIQSVLMFPNGVRCEGRCGRSPRAGRRAKQGQQGKHREQGKHWKARRAEKGGKVGQQESRETKKSRESKENREAMKNHRKSDDKR